MDIDNTLDLYIEYLQCVKFILWILTSLNLYFGYGQYVEFIFWESDSVEYLRSDPGCGSSTYHNQDVLRQIYTMNVDSVNFILWILKR